MDCVLILYVSLYAVLVFASTRCSTQHFRTLSTLRQFLHETQKFVTLISLYFLVFSLCKLSLLLGVFYGYFGMLATMAYFIISRINPANPSSVRVGEWPQMLQIIDSQWVHAGRLIHTDARIPAAYPISIDIEDESIRSSSGPGHSVIIYWYFKIRQCL